ncbi:MAG TPA: hypothetical protein V6C97_19630 [Oculatellaceae cyanobacterium]
MSLRSKSARVLVLSMYCGYCLSANIAHASPPYMMDDFLPPAQTDKSNQGQQNNVDKTPSAPSQGPDAEPLHGKAETQGGQSVLDGNAQGQAKGAHGGKVQGAGSAPLQGKAEGTMLKAKTQSNMLQGGVHATGAVLSPIKLHMTPDQLKSAVSQYSADLRQFYLDVKDYHLASEALKKQIGECTENEQQWQAKLSKDKLQLNNVVIATGVTNMPPPPPTPPDIPPPRVCCAGCLITGRCGHLGTGGGPNGAAATRADSQREAMARADLAKTQAQLGVAETEGQFIHQKAFDEAKIEQSQQNLAEKFGRLKQEYDTLKIEKEALTGVKVN